MHIRPIGSVCDHATEPVGMLSHGADDLFAVRRQEVRAAGFGAAGGGGQGTDRGGAIRPCDGAPPVRTARTIV